MLPEITVEVVEESTIINMAFKWKAGTINNSLHCLDNGINRAETNVLKEANNKQKTTIIRIWNVC